MSTDLRHGRHCVFNLHVHLVFVTKYRKQIFTKEHIEYLQGIFNKVCLDFDAQLVECDGERDHIHLLINYPTKISISKLTNSLKGVSSRMLKKQFPILKDCYYNGVLWTPSYFASSCGGASLDIIKKYIENQNTPS
jgi:putative transposase